MAHDIYEVMDTQSVCPIKVDGKYFRYLCDEMYRKFEDQSDPDKRVDALKNNAISIFQKIQKLQTANNSQRNLLLVGKVQSGKTSNMQMAIALAFDNGYNTLVLYGGYDTVLLGQAVTRFRDETFKKPEGMSPEDAQTQWVNVISTQKNDSFPLSSLDEDSLREIFEDGGKLIFICMKNTKHLESLNDFFSSMPEDVGIRPLIFDDEGDQASLNNEFRKDDESATYASIVKMKSILKNPVYLSVTATPQALIFQPDSSQLDPADLQLIHPGDGYTGLDAFHRGLSSHIVTVDDDIDDNLEKNRLSPSLIKAVRVYLLSSALLLKKGVRNTQMLIHFDKLTDKHQIVFTLINQRLTQIISNIKNGQEKTVNAKLAQYKALFDDVSLFGEQQKMGYTFEDIVDELRTVIQKSYVALQNSKGKETMHLLPRKRYQIRIGADLMQRGVSFKDLIITYFTRWPRGTSNMDTQIQRARWLGYRKDTLDYCRVFTTKKIALSFDSLREIEEDMWDQMGEVESGSRPLTDIMVSAPSDEVVKLRPSRRSATDYEMKRFGQKWLNQFYAVSDDDLIKAVNKSLEDIYFSHEAELVPTTEGSTVNHVTAYQCYISKAELSSLVNNSSIIFNSRPFGGVERFLKAVGEYRINMLFFWDPNRASVKEHKFYGDQRSRTFTLIDESYRVSALQQGASPAEEEKKTYLGDAKVISDKNAVSIQVFPMYPKAKDDASSAIIGKFQYMFSVHMPKAVAVFARSEDDE